MINLKYTGSFEELKEKLHSLGGVWDENQPNKKVLRVEDGILNWYVSTGTLQIQGRGTGKDRIDAEVPHLLYPGEYNRKVENSVIKQPIPESSPTGEKHTIEHTYLMDGLQESELIIGIVNAVGTETSRVITPLKDRLRGFGYTVNHIKVSSLLPAPTSGCGEYERISSLMNEGDNARKAAKNNAILSAGACLKIKEYRSSNKAKVAHIIDSLKHPDEVSFMRKVYNSGFYLFGIHSDEKRRRNYLVNDKSLNQEQANTLIRIDEDEKIAHGQRTRDTFHLSDFFISLGKNEDQVKHTIQRFLELIFSHPFKGPTFDEFAMFMAFNSSIRSSDLSRQVGAVITRDEQIVAMGANDTPKYGGGQYFAKADPSTGEIADFPDGKDYTRDADSNKKAQREIIDEIIQILIKEKIVDRDAEEQIVAALNQSKITDLTEFGRVVHAEMEAILSCGRASISTAGSTMYSTTFPCHNCAKHIIDSGIKRVVYVEPYPKSRALDLHAESIELKTSHEEENSPERVIFEPFTGVGARRFLDLFSMVLGNGEKVKRKNKEGDTVEWSKDSSVMRTPLLPKSYIEVEEAAAQIWNNRKGQL